ncbi:MAG TPA: hypothetical protein VGC77_12475 [Rhodopseudomonas sp.]|uniref:hypothetical protein n=1 Tax=Rhodopseudomonas sp. TaxID=1078 RepID=UPI002EDB64C1
MHVERRGGPPDLQAAFAHFVVHHLHGRLLDDQKDLEAKLGKFPDFACYRDLILIEMKHLESEQNERVNDAFKKKVIPDEEPLFYGTRRVDLGKLSNGDEIRLAILNKLAKTIETHLSKASQQFSEYLARNPRKNSVSICVILNSQVDEFSPDVVMHAVHRKLKPTAQGQRFSNIDAVVYVSEKHFQKLPDGRIAFAIVNVINMPAIEQAWKMEIVDVVGQKWSQFRTGDTPVTGNPDQFESIEDIPESMARHEAWKLAYRRNPYLRSKSDHELKLHFHRCVALNSLSFLKGGWPKPAPDQTELHLRRFDDSISEMNFRNLDLRQFSPRLLTSNERQVIYAGLPEELVRVLSSQTPDPADVKTK